VSAPWIHSEAYRFIAVTLVVILGFAQLDVFFGDMISGYFSSGYARYGGVRFVVEGNLLLLRIIHALFAVLFALASAALVCLWERSGGNRLNSPSLKGGFFIAVLVLGVIPFVFYPGFHGDVGRLLSTGLSRGLIMVGVGAGVGLLVFAHRLAVELSLSRAVHAAALAVSLVVTIIGFWLPWFGVGLFALALARYAASLPLLGLSTLFLVSCTVLEYYSHATTLLQKSQSLGIVALALTLAAVALHKRLLQALKEGTFAIPGPLLEFCAPAAVGKQASPCRCEVILRSALGAVLVIFIGLFVHSVQDKEELLENGKSVILPLRPIDPRSLMQGDYMVLGFFSLEDAIRNALEEGEEAQKNGDSGLRLPRKGLAIIEPDEKGVYRFVALHDPEQPLTEKQLKIVYRLKGRYRISAQIGSRAFFFQEGHGRAYEAARYAELKVDDEGNTLIARLLDGSLKLIEPKEELKESRR
jgi:uncharacterized membrane-anchored protein